MSEFEPDSGAGASDEKARREAVAIERGLDLEKDGKIQGHARNQTFRNHVNVAALILFWLLVVCIGLGIIVFVWHVLMPEGSHHFLKPPQLAELRTLLGAAVLSSALTSYAHKRMAD